MTLPPRLPAAPPTYPPAVVQRSRDLGRLYAAVQAAQSWAEMAVQTDLAQELRAIRSRVWELILGMVRVAGDDPAETMALYDRSGERALADYRANAEALERHGVALHGS